jgi:hypothetical protein
VRSDKKAIELAVLIALVFGMAFVGPQPSHASQVDRIQVIDASRDDGTSERRNIGRPFDQSSRCSEKRRVRNVPERAEKQDRVREWVCTRGGRVRLRMVGPLPWR